MRRIHDDADQQVAKRRSLTAPIKADAEDRPASESEPNRTSLESLQKSAGNSAVQQVVSAGERVPPGIRAAAERRLGRDLGDVRIHTDAAARAYAGSLGAEAVTLGKDVYFGDGAPDVSTSRGQKTYVHELTHAAQANPGASASLAAVSDPRSPAEREARQIARSGLGGTAVSPAQTASAGVAHRQATTLEEERLELDGAAPAPPREAAAPAPAPAPAPATGPGQPVAMPEPLSPFAALYRAAIVDRIRAAVEAFASSPPNYQLAYAELDSIVDPVRAMRESYRTTNPELGMRIASLGNTLQYVRALIQPKVGITWTDDVILGRINSLLSMAEETGTHLR